MNKIDIQLDKIKKENRLGIMNHIVVGYPNLEESKELVRTMARAGADFIELQVPFSDPMADGPTIMKANKVALDNNTKVKDCFNAMKELSSEVDIPLIFMGYFNIVHSYGVKKFCADAKKAGASGLIFPDVPLDEEKQEKYIEMAEKNDLYPIRLLSPASTEERIKKNAEIGKGFVYFVSRKGTTGVKAEMDKGLENNINNLKKYFDIPIAVGFGINKKEHIMALKGKAQVAVIGSAAINAYDDAEQGKGLEAVEEFLKSLIEEARN